MFPAARGDAFGMDMDVFRAVVTGRVQGVNFRHESAMRARALGINGYVKNLWSGDVEVVAQGNRSQLERYLDFLRTGPPAAQVTKVDVRWGHGTDEGPFETFEIRW